MGKPNKSKNQTEAESSPELVWLKASYHLHTFAYRDPRSAFASGTALPVVSPTTILLGIVSTLFMLGKADEAQNFINSISNCEVLVDSPEGIIFFRAFHQLRRYETLKYGANSRFGLTKINQGTREYGLVDGLMTIYVGVQSEQTEDTKFALKNLRHLGTHDSMCSLKGKVEFCDKPLPKDVLYLPSQEVVPEFRKELFEVLEDGLSIITLSTFKKGEKLNQKLKHWYLTGGNDTELISYVIAGFFQGTTNGKIFRKKKEQGTIRYNRV